LQKSTADVLTAIQREADARLLAAGKNKDEVKRIEGEIVDIKKAALIAAVGQYQQYVASLTALETQHLNNVKALNDQRKDIELALEDKLRSIRSSGLSDYDKFNQALQEIDKDTSLAKQALVAGDFVAAEKYAQRAIALTDEIKGGVTSDGREIVSALQGQELAVNKVKGAYDVLLDVNAKRTKQDKDAADGIAQSLTTAKDKLLALRSDLNDLNTKLAEGLNTRLDINTDDIARAKAALDDLTKPRTVVVTIETVNASGTPVDIPTSSSGGGSGEHFARGGFAGAVQRFAQGGAAIFSRPTWSKVPGSGHEDTVPALLRAGSFVVRKPASAYYGDSLMGRLAQGYASGGPVGGIANAILLGAKSKTGLGPSGFEEFRATLDELFKLKENAQSLVHSSTGLDIAEWAARIIEKFPIFDAKRRQFIKDLLDSSFDGWLQTIEEARKFHVPAVMDFATAALAFRKGGGGRGFGTDTVPAMLTPGEFVLNKQAVDTYGSDLLHAVNSMRISPDALAGMLSAPRPIARFAAGGQVGGGSVTIGGRGAAPQINITFNVDGKDLLSDAQIDKKIIPRLNDAMRRASQKLTQN
jgi:hypothetical protein